MKYEHENCKFLTATSLMTHVRIYVCAEEHFHDQQKFVKFTKINARHMVSVIVDSYSSLVIQSHGHSFSHHHPVQLPVEWSGGREILEYTNRLLDSCMHMFMISVSLRHRGRSATHTHTHTYLCSLSSSYILHLLPLLPVLRVSYEHQLRSKSTRGTWALFGIAILFNPIAGLLTAERRRMASAKPKSLHWNQWIVGA